MAAAGPVNNEVGPLLCSVNATRNGPAPPLVSSHIARGFDKIHGRTRMSLLSRSTEPRGKENR